jgi:hypothetical protein
LSSAATPLPESRPCDAIGAGKVFSCRQSRRPQGTDVMNHFARIALAAGMLSAPPALSAAAQPVPAQNGTPLTGTTSPTPSTQTPPAAAATHRTAKTKTPATQKPTTHAALPSSTAKPVPSRG